MFCGIPLELFDRIEVHLRDESGLRWLALCCHPDLTMLPPGSTLYVRELSNGEYSDGTFAEELAIDQSGYVVTAIGECGDFDLDDTRSRRRSFPKGEPPSRPRAIRPPQCWTDADFHANRASYQTRATALQVLRSAPGNRPHSRPSRWRRRLPHAAARLPPRHHHQPPAAPRPTQAYPRAPPSSCASSAHAVSWSSNRRAPVSLLHAPSKTPNDYGALFYSSAPAAATLVTPAQVRTLRHEAMRAEPTPLCEAAKRSSTTWL